MKISIGMNGFYYFNFSFLERLKYIEDLDGITGIEIVVKHGYKFSNEELEILSNYKYNTLHLLGYSKKDRDWVFYCKNTIPNFCHFVLHPDNSSVSDLNDIDEEVSKLISFENMDTRKSAFQKPVEMISLFKKFPKSKFTFDINHAEENNINPKDFDQVKFPEQIHFSVVNKGYYSDYPEVDTPHSLSCLEKGFNFNLNKYSNCIITMEGLFIPGKKNLIQKEINLIKKLLKK